MNWDEFTELKIIGIDEIAMTKGHSNFVAIITTQQTDGHVALLGVLADRQKETVRQFFESIPSRLWQTMEKVCTDMWEGHANAVAEFDKAHPEVSMSPRIIVSVWIISASRNVTVSKRNCLRWNTRKFRAYCGQSVRIAKT